TARPAAVDDGRSREAPRRLAIEHHHGTLAAACLLDRAKQQASILDDRDVALPEKLARAVVDGPLRLDGPIVVDVDVGAHAGKGRVLLLVRIEAVTVRLVEARLVDRQR